MEGSAEIIVSMPSRAYTSFLREIGIIVTKLDGKGVNALSGLYLISTQSDFFIVVINIVCQCPLGLIPHFYSTPSKT